MPGTTAVFRVVLIEDIVRPTEFLIYGSIAGVHVVGRNGVSGNHGLNGDAESEAQPSVSPPRATAVRTGCCSAPNLHLPLLLPRLRGIRHCLSLRSPLAVSRSRFRRFRCPLTKGFCVADLLQKAMTPFERSSIADPAPFRQLVQGHAITHADLI